MKLRTEMTLHYSVEDLGILDFGNTAILSKNLCIELLILGILHRLQLEQCSASRIISKLQAKHTGIYRHVQPQFDQCK